MKIYDETSDCIWFHSRISSRCLDKGINRVGAPSFFFFFFGKSECAAMSWLTGMAEGKEEKKSCYLCTQS